jgi:predicted kinase
VTGSSDRLFVVVSGPPASGKSTLAPALSAALDLPLLAKDTIKDALMSALGVADLDESRRLGSASVDVLYAVAADLSGAVLEAPFHRSRARPRLHGLRAPIVEVFCRCDRETLRRRYEERSRARPRAAGHFDESRSPDELWNDEIAVPVAGGWPVIEVDTTGSADVAAVADQVRRAAAPDDLLDKTH